MCMLLKKHLASNKQTYRQIVFLYKGLVCGYELGADYSCNAQGADKELHYCNLSLGSSHPQGQIISASSLR